MVMSMNFVCPLPPSVFTMAVSVMIVASLAIVGLSEARGESPEQDQDVAPLLAGFPRGTPFFLIFPDGDLRFLILRSAISLHFFKRILEWTNEHEFHGGHLSHLLLSTVSLIYLQHLSQGLPEPPVDLLYRGIALFLNWDNRKEVEGEYKISKGGLFGWVICPHYLFKVIDFVGISFISQSVYSCTWSLATFFYLLGRSNATRRWYTSKFKDFPGDDKAFIPFIF
ncbi:hypothetical protein ACJRO7_028697 [Eucalyptus globulus]|uniref:3-oxo-5-alpha-steroid 4-dehydrogenase C-terminal domain-containing protein n=1 Tax=Eucalyptus globulus TaxID=34317 RepID=A0ABD3JW19_EUCGL